MLEITPQLYGVTFHFFDLRLLFHGPLEAGTVMNLIL